MKDLFDREEAAKITHALDEMKAEAGDGFSLETVNLAELERRCGIIMVPAIQTTPAKTHVNMVY